MLIHSAADVLNDKLRKLNRLSDARLRLVRRPPDAEMSREYKAFELAAMDSQIGALRATLPPLRLVVDNTAPQKPLLTKESD